jgi:subtilisin family serine protease
MKRSIILKVISLLCVLSLFLSTFWFGSIASAKNMPDNASKIGSLLSQRIEIKSRLSESDNFSMEQIRISDLEVQSLGEISNLDTEKIFLYFGKYPTASQKKDLKSSGITLYPDSWIPPVGGFLSGYMLADMPIDNVYDLASKNYIQKIDTAEQMSEPRNDQARKAMNVGSIWAEGNDGSGVTIAVLDSGIDTSNPDFPDLDSSNSKDYSNYDGTLASLDDTIINEVNGHGTHVTGSVLGRGVNSTTYKGVAPGADLVFLKIGNDTTSGATSAAIVGAIQAAVDIYDVDIITMSYGGWSASHDGTDAMCQAVDYAVSRGVTVFMSAGNNADNDWHYSGIVNAGSTSPEIEINITGTEGASTVLAFNLVWADGLDVHNRLSLTYHNSDHTQINPVVTYLQSESQRGTENYYSYYNNYVEEGTYYLRVRNTSSNDQVFHIYYYGGSHDFKFGSPDPFYTLDSPAEADGAIAVGAYVTREGWTNYQDWSYTFNPREFEGTVASFSSRGPRVDNSSPDKPDILAPGSAIISTRDSVFILGGSHTPSIIDNDGSNDGKGPADYYVMEGTSMACPLAAGAGALLLAGDPTLTPVRLKHTLQATAMELVDSGKDNTNGWGLINVEAAVKLNTTLDSFSDPDNTIECDNFTHYSNQTIVYIYGTGYLKNHEYSVSYYDCQDDKIADYRVSSSETGTLSSQYDLASIIDSGTWHVAVSEPGFSFAETYNSADPCVLAFCSFFVDSPKISFITSARTISTGVASDIISIQTQSSSGIPVNMDSTVSINLASSSVDGGFSLNPAVWSDIDSVEIPAGDSTASFYYRDINMGTPTLTASCAGFTSGVQQEMVNLENASQIRVETAADGSGVVLPAKDLIAGASITAYSILRDKSGGFIANIAAVWLLENLTGGVSVSDLVPSLDYKSAVFTGHLVGSADLHIALDGLTSVNPGTVIVRASSKSQLAIETAFDGSGASLISQDLQAGDSLTGYAILRDRFGNFIGNTSAVWSLPSSNITGGVASSDLVARNGDKSAVFTGYLIGTTKIHASSGSFTADSGIITVVPNDLAELKASGYPVSVKTGTAGDITISAQDDCGNTRTDYLGTIHFSSSDSLAVLPADYTFLSQDQGSHVFSVIFKTVGAQSITIADALNSSLCATQSGIQVKKSTGGGGGGGGGGGNIREGNSSLIEGKTVSTDIFGSHSGLRLDASGKTLDVLSIVSPDGVLTIDIPVQTRILDSTGKPVTALSAALEENPSSLTVGSEMLGTAYNFGPDGATFDPPATFIYHYSDDCIPRTMEESDLTLAYYNNKTQSWITLVGVLDTAANTIIVNISHFSTYAMIGSTASEIVLSGLDILPNHASIGEKVTISLTLKNLGGKEGTYPVQIYINGVEELKEVVTVKPGASFTINHDVTRQISADYVVTIGDLTGRFKVVEPQPVDVTTKPASTTQIVKPPPQIEIMPQDVNLSPVVIPEVSPKPVGTGYVLIVAIILIVAVAIVLIAFFKLRHVPKQR